MSLVPTRERAGSRRALALVLAAVVGVAVLGLAVTLANASSASRVAENASLLHWTNSAHGSAALARSAVGQSVLFALSRELGVADEQATATAVAEAEESLTVFREWADDVPPILSVTSPRLDEQLATFGSAGTEVLSLVSVGDHEAATRLRDGSFESAYNMLVGTVQTSQDLVAQRISLNEDRAAFVAQLMRLLVTLLIPAVALVVYWLIARRQLSQRRLEVNARIAAQREMVAGVSHELRTPLTAIYGFSEVLLDQDGLDQAVATELVTAINTEAADLTRMVDDLLVAARIDMNELTFAAREFAPAREIDTVAIPFVRAGHDVQIGCMPGTIIADEARFRQIVRNLISNAVRHGGPTCVVTGTWDDHGARFTVMDDGPRVDEELENRLFEPYTNHGDKALLRGSVGLGLAISRAVARGMGGELSYDHSDGWASFSLTLPASPTMPADRHEVAPVDDLGEFAAPTGEWSRQDAAAPSTHR